VAEGIETVEQMVFLKGLGCDQLQGYLFSPPVPVAEFEKMVAEDRRLKFD
jgi:EAL domain-containing protein (putative c-di-GMP-specific phosphodiesterase class I)